MLGRRGRKRGGTRTQTRGITWMPPRGKAVQSAGTCGVAMPSLRPLLPFTPSTTFSHRDIEQGVGPRSPRTPRLDAAFSAVPMQGVVLPGRFSSTSTFSRFEHTTTWNTAVQSLLPTRLPRHASVRSSAGRPPTLSQPWPASASLGQPRPIRLAGHAGRCSRPGGARAARVGRRRC